jgi:mannose-6-phosphate isomerase-like protein (cupin superfamily)
MSLKPGEDIGMEIHKYIDQILVFVQGNGEANINGQKSPIKEGDLAFVPAGIPHDFTNIGSTDLKLYTTYSPPNHSPGTLQITKADTKGYKPKLCPSDILNSSSLASSTKSLIWRPTCD